MAFSGDPNRSRPLCPCGGGGGGGGGGFDNGARRHLVQSEEGTSERGERERDEADERGTQCKYSRSFVRSFRPFPFGERVRSADADRQIDSSFVLFRLPNCAQSHRRRRRRSVYRVPTIPTVRRGSAAPLPLSHLAVVVVLMLCGIYTL